MSLFDQFKGALNQMESLAPAALLTALGNTNLGDLQGMVQKLQQGGLQQQVQSWLSNGSNLSITAEQLQSALGNDQVRQLAQQFGLPVDETLKVLAQHLPAVVDQASPDGTLQTH